VAAMASAFVAVAEAALGRLTLIAGRDTGAVYERWVIRGLVAGGGFVVRGKAPGGGGNRSNEESKKEPATKTHHDRDPLDRARPTTPRPRRNPA